MDKFTQTFLYRIGADWTAQDVEVSKKYDLIAVQGFRWNTVEGDTWGEMKKANPNVLIFPYYGSHSDDNSDHKPNPYKGNMGRWNISRDHSMGNTNTDNPDLFYLTGGGNRISAAPAYPHSWALDYGNPGAHQYWLEAYTTDNVNQPWEADGVMLDTVPVRFTGLDGLPAGFTDIGWQKDMQSYLNTLSKELYKHNHKIWGNTGVIKTQDDIDAYVGLDKIANPIYFSSSEGAFVVCWGYGDCQFYPEKVWLLQVQVSNKIHNMKYGVQSTVGGSFRTSEIGLDNYNRTLTLYDAIWYGLCSYHLGKNTVDNNTYFGFTRATYSSGEYYDEFDIDLGEALDTFKVTNIGGNNIYFREFKLGYVYVNPTRNDVSNIPLLQMCKELTHDNFEDDLSTIPDIDILSLASNRGTMLLKTVPDQPCEGVVCLDVCLGADLWSQRCDPATGTCVNDQLLERNSVNCGYDPCEGVVCENICLGADLYSQKCVDGICVTDQLIESNSATCGYDPCVGVVCDNVCLGADLYSQKCVDGFCVTDQLLESNSVGCISDPCAGVVCSNICVGDNLWSRHCDPATGQCVLDQLLQSDSINCKIPEEIPSDENTIQTYLILGGLGIVALAILSMKK